jgi:hypothetical protein
MLLIFSNPNVAPSGWFDIVALTMRLDNRITATLAVCLTVSLELEL